MRVDDCAENFGLESNRTSILVSGLGGSPCTLVLSCAGGLSVWPRMNVVLCALLGLEEVLRVTGGVEHVDFAVDFQK